MSYDLRTGVIFNTELPDPWSSKNLVFKVDESQVFLGHILLVVVLLPVQATGQGPCSVLQKDVQGNMKVFFYVFILAVL